MSEKLDDDIAVVCEMAFEELADRRMVGHQALRILDDAIAELTPEELVEAAETFRDDGSLFGYYMWNSFEVADAQRQAAEDVHDHAAAVAYDDAAHVIQQIGTDLLHAPLDSNQPVRDLQMSRPLQTVLEAIILFRQTVESDAPIEASTRALLKDLKPSELKIVGTAAEFPSINDDYTRFPARRVANEQLAAAVATGTDVESWYRVAKDLGSSIADLIVTSNKPPTLERSNT